MAAPFLQIQNIVKEFDGYKAVNNVSIDIEKGEIFSLLGPSGCGKTTLLRMLGRFETPTSGRIILNGQDLADMPPYECPINMMFQSYALFPHLTVWDNIAFGLRREGMAKDKIAEQVEAMLKLTQLGKFAKRKPHQLSGGQQQRVALARSLAKKPTLLLLDEPLGALDKKLREQTQIELVNIIESVGVTCVMVTHDQEEAMTMSTRIGVMNAGQILQISTPAEMYETPANKFVAGFVGNVNLMDGVLSHDQPDHVIIDSADCKHYVGHGITGTEGMDVTVALRPEKIRVTREKPEGEYNMASGKVKEMTYFGAWTVYQIELPSGFILKASESNTERHAEGALTWGDTAWASWSTSAHVVLTS
jgi:putrescine transport system ATP-binding protein